MRTIHIVLTVFICSIGLATFQSPAAAQASRTWVSGVGDDVNPCSRTAPCKTFAGAISKTATKGEINCLDPGGYGAVTITKSITISCSIGTAGITVAGTNGIIVNLPSSTDKVYIVGLDLQGNGSGLDGIKIIGSGTTFIRNTIIHDFTGNAVNLVGTSGARAVIVDSQLVGNTGGLNIQGAGGVSNVGILSRTFADGHSSFSTQVAGPSKLILTDSTLLGSAVGIGINGGSPTITSYGNNTIGGTGDPTVTNPLK